MRKLWGGNICPFLGRKQSLETLDRTAVRQTLGLDISQDTMGGQILCKKTLGMETLAKTTLGRNTDHPGAPYARLCEEPGTPFRCLTFVDIVGSPDGHLGLLLARSIAPDNLRRPAPVRKRCGQPQTSFPLLSFKPAII